MLIEAVYWTLKAILIMGYIGIFLFMYIESTIFPLLPSEVILLLVGVLVYLNQFNFWLVILISTLGSLAGYLTLYYIGRNHSDTFVLKYGKWFFMKKKHLDKANAWFRKYGQWSVFWARFMAGLRHFISIPAGSAKMPLKEFIIYSSASTAMWNAFLLGIGYYFGKRWDVIANNYRGAQLWLLVVTLAMIFGSIYYIQKQVSKEKLEVAQK